MTIHDIEVGKCYKRTGSFLLVNYALVIAIEADKIHFRCDRQLKRTVPISYFLKSFDIFK